MTNVKVVIREKTDNNAVHEYNVISAKVSQNGKKKPDELTVTLPLNAIVNEGDEISYIEDVADLDYCSAIWNFYLQPYDERGYNIDATTIPLSVIRAGRFSNALAGKFYGYYGLEFNTALSWTRINTSLTDRIDFTKQFDIFVWFYPSSTQTQTKPIVWSKYDGSRGIEIGFDTSGGAGNWRPFMRTGDGTTTTNTSGTTTLITASQPNLLRVYRDELDVIHMEVMGIADDTNLTESASFQVPSQTVYMGGGNHSVTDRFEGHIFQARCYSGNYLSEADAFNILQCKPQAMIMKFAGKIYDRKSNTTYKTVQAQSWAQKLYNWTVSADSITEAPFGGVARGAAGGATANQYDAGQDFLLIIQDLLHNLDTDFKVGTDITGDTLAGVFYADGNFIDITTYLSIYGLLTFHTTPRKIVAFESIVGVDTNIQFIQSPTQFRQYNITEDNVSDLALFNEVSIVGQGGAVGYYKTVDTGDDLKTLKLNAPQFSDATDLDTLAFNMWAFNGVIVPRYVVTTGSSVHHVRYNHIVELENASKNISVPPLVDLPRLPIASIELSYPNPITIIHVGQYPLDVTENIRNSAQATRGLQSNTTV